MALPPQLTAAQRAQLERLRSSGDLPNDSALLELAIAHQVAAPLAVWAQRRGDVVPAAWKARLNQVRAMNLVILMQARALRDLLNASGLPWLAAKGLARALDPLLPDRFIGDIDLYVPAETAIDVVQVLDADYRCLDQAWDVYIMAQVLLPRHAQGVPIDLHRSWHGWVGGDEGAITRFSVAPRCLDGFPLPSFSDDLRIALYETLYSTWNNPLRRLWELQAMAERLPVNALCSLLLEMGLADRALTVPDRFLRVSRLRVSRRFSGALAMILASRNPLLRAFGLARMRLGFMR